MRVLVTRPLEDSEETARLLTARGHQPLLAPLLTTQFRDGPELALQDIQAILATSANGVRALARRTPQRDVPLFAVGPQTAAQAQRLGFRIVKNADGDATALARATKDWTVPGKGALLHVAGAGNDGKLVQMLGGFTVRQEILYAVTAVEAMPPGAVLALRQAAVDAALFFSPRSACVFRDCVLREDLAVKSVTALCISAATAAALSPLAFRQVRIADQPNQYKLLELLI